MDYDYIETDVQKTNVFSFAPSVMYVGKIGGKFYYTPEFSIGFGFGNMKVEGSPTKVDVTNYVFGLSPLSFEFRPTLRLGVNLSAGNLSYSSLEYELSSDYSDTSISRESWALISVFTTLSDLLSGFTFNRPCRTCH